MVPSHSSVLDSGGWGHWHGGRGQTWRSWDIPCRWMWCLWECTVWHASVRPSIATIALSVPAQHWGLGPLIGARVLHLREVVLLGLEEGMEITA